VAETSSDKVHIEVIDSGIAYPEGDGDESKLDGAVDGRVVDEVLDHEGHRDAGQLGELGQIRVSVFMGREYPLT
jgi:hypothetical protein